MIQTIGDGACYVALIGLSMAVFGVIIPLMFRRHPQKRGIALDIKWPQPWDNDTEE